MIAKAELIKQTLLTKEPGGLTMPKLLTAIEALVNPATSEAEAAAELLGKIAEGTFPIMLFFLVDENGSPSDCFPIPES